MPDNLDVIFVPMSGATVTLNQSSTINNGGLLVKSPGGSGFADTNYVFGAGYNGNSTFASTLPGTGTVFDNYNLAFTGCASAKTC